MRTFVNTNTRLVVLHQLPAVLLTEMEDYLAFVHKVDCVVFIIRYSREDTQKYCLDTTD